MNYRKSAGTVTSINGNTAAVLLSGRDEFSACRAKGCHVCSAPTKRTELKVRISNTDLAVGDAVIVSVPTVDEAAAAAVVFLVPLLAVFAAALAVTQLFGLSLESKASVLVLTAVFFISFTVPIFFDRILKIFHPVTIEKHGDRC